MHREKHVDFWSTVVLIVTVTLFGTSIFVNGFTHELMLEAGVFLVSLKLVLGGRKLELRTERLEERLDSILEHLRAEAAAHHPPGDAPINWEPASEAHPSAGAAPRGS